MKLLTFMTAVFAVAVAVLLWDVMGEWLFSDEKSDADTLS